MQRDTVSREDLERELQAIEAHAPGQIEGVFGPASMTWRVHREAAIFLGAGRALLLQLAHPWVAAAIAEHSRTLADPIGRFHRTFNITFTLVFGTLDQALIRRSLCAGGGQRSRPNALKLPTYDEGS